MEKNSKRVIEVQRGEAWVRVPMAEVHAGDRFRMWEDEAKQRYLGCFRADEEPRQQTDGVWGIVVMEET
jgi:hypothetical protein